MAMNVIVHVGPHKTATTSLQHFLYDNRAELLSIGVCYPVISPGVPNKISHNDLASSMIRGDDEQTSVFLDLIEEMSWKSNALILSAEDFSSCVNTKMGDGMRLLESRFENVKYVFVDRDDVSRLTSSLIHLLAENRKSITRYGSLETYLKASIEFSRKQRAFFDQRDAEFIDFNSLISGRVGSTFLRRVLDMDFFGSETTANTKQNYTSIIESLPPDEKRDVSLFVSGVPDDEGIDGEGAGIFIRRHVELFLAKIQCSDK